MIGVGNFTIVRVLFMLSLDRLPATTHAYLVNFVGVVTMLMSIASCRSGPPLCQILGAALAVSGLHVFFREIPPPSEFIGAIYVAIAVLALASNNNITRKLAVVTRDGLSNTIISTVALWIGGLPVVLAGLMIDWPPPVVGWINWGIILLNAIIGVAIVLTVFNYMLRTLRSYEASILAILRRDLHGHLGRPDPGRAPRPAPDRRDRDDAGGHCPGPGPPWDCARTADH